MVGNWVTSDTEPLTTIYEYDGSGKMIYMGQHHLPPSEADTSLADWRVIKFTWSGNNLVNRERVSGCYDDRATLAWS